MKILKTICLATAGLIILTLIAATIIEKYSGTEFVSEHIYGTEWFAAIWTIMAVSSALYIISRKLYRHKAAFLIHTAFLTILCGALVTHLKGIQGSIHLRLGENATETFTTRDGYDRTLPFKISLDKFEIEYYQGTRSPMDFSSHIRITKSNDITEGRVSMNKIFKYNNYRFYQASYDEDMQGTTLNISHDPYGIGITYTGYCLLLVSIVLFFFEKKSMFKSVIHSKTLRGCAMFLAMAAASTASAEASGTKTIPDDVATEMCSIYIYYNGRVCPLETLAKDFTIKLCGNRKYKGLSSQQVLTGWMFFYPNWKKEEMIKINSGKVRKILRTESKYASLEDFIDSKGEYKLQQALREKDAAVRHEIIEADEKFNIISMLCTGSMLKIFPYQDQAGKIVWASQTDKLPENIPYEQRLFIQKSMNYINEFVQKEDWKGVKDIVGKLKTYQTRMAENELPPVARFTAERIYNRMEYTLPVAAALVIAGMAAFAYTCRLMISSSNMGKRAGRVLSISIVVPLAYLTACMSLRWIAGGHIPLSNGYETMQFLAWCTLLLTLIIKKRYKPAIPFGLLIAGLAMLVSMFGESNPQITNLMPVLASPLLSAHVMLVMLAYSLFAFMMMNGIAGIVMLWHGHSSQSEHLAMVSRVMLYPAIFCLTAGIFVGAVWANVSWGRYWGWDPKEVWALVTMMVYAAAIHTDSIRFFRNPSAFHLFCIVAFGCVITTYFGVNFLLGGMHSYAVQ